MRRLLLLLTALVLVAALAGCSDDGGGDEEEGGGETTEATDGGGEDDGASPGADGSEFDDVAALRDALTADGIECDLDYEGLADEGREVSQCVINGEQAVISIWFEDALRDDVVTAIEETPGAVVAAGGNWTVEVTSAEVAQSVADALEGEVVGGEPAPTTTAAG